MMSCSPATALVILLHIVLVSANYVDVDTNYGTIRGRTLQVNGRQVNEFYGIPFAEPPVGLYRFAKPRKIERFSGCYDTTAVTPLPCTQNSRMGEKSGEDCLYLNLWSQGASRRNKLLPVYIHIHGGAFRVGSAMDPKLNASAIVNESVIVVINYRLGVFGFFDGNREDAPGNLGLWDQAAAINWVKENVIFFKGDPDNITLMGPSAGGASVAIHLTSPVTRSLFTKAVVMSMAYLHTSKDMAITSSINFASKFGCPADEAVECMRSFSGRQILEASEDFQSEPSFGDEIYPMKLLRAIDDGNYNNEIPILWGGLNNEGNIFVIKQCADIPGFEAKKPGVATKQSAKECFGRILPEQVADEAREYYLNLADNNDSSAIRQLTGKALGDYTFVCPAYFSMSAIAERRSDQRIYGYRISYGTKQSALCRGLTWPRPCHADEDYVILGDPFRRPTLFNQTDIAYAKQFTNMWSVFGRTGHPPTISGRPWPAYQDAPGNKGTSRGKVWPSVKEINPFKRPSTIRNPYPDCDKFWSKHIDLFY
ncbi:Acetylcholinesterase [Halotydeus destructor]|nr:Acetylcholinesterase [Halotydeus destructor]